MLGTTTPEDAATWMDEMRSDPAYDYMKPWHFVNTEKGATYKPAPNTIISELERVYRELEQPKKLSNEEQTAITCGHCFLSKRRSSLPLHSKRYASGSYSLWH